jgi:hypothetical protein
MNITPEQYTFIREMLQGDPNITDDPLPELTGEHVLDSLALIMGIIRDTAPDNPTAAELLAPAARIVGQYAVRHGYIA